MKNSIMHTSVQEFKLNSEKVKKTILFDIFYFGGFSDIGKKRSLLKLGGLISTLKELKSGKLLELLLRWPELKSWHTVVCILALEDRKLRTTYSFLSWCCCKYTTGFLVSINSN